MTFMDPGRRDDLALETDELLDGSGNYTGAWLESAGISTIRVACALNAGGSPVVSIEEGIFTTTQGTPKVVRTQYVPVSSNNGFSELDLTARFFRLVVSGAPASTLLRATVRRV